MANKESNEGSINQQSFVKTIKKYVLLSEINNIDLMKRYRIIHPEINGLFFISKISSFNPEKTDATEITLIQI